MNILLASAEVSPFAKTGGLADITSSLPKEWHKYGQSPVIIMPKFREIDVDKYGFIPTNLILYVPVGTWTEFARLWYGKLAGSDVPVYLVENNDYFDRDGLYGDSRGEYTDNDRRFLFFCRAVFEASKALNFSPDVIHAHDYHAAFTMAFLKSFYKYDPLFSRTAGVYTIHNLAYQGWFFPDRAMKFATYNPKEFYPGCWFEQGGMVNAMKTGIMFADKTTTVSPNYAKEIRIPYYSEGLQDVLNQRGGDLVGLVNGVYYDDWSPENDGHIYHKYSPETLGDKALNKYELLKSFGINEEDNPELPLIGMVTRLTEQKGIDLIISKIYDYMSNGSFRLILLGSGDSGYENFFRELSARFPTLALVTIGYDNTLSHRIIAGSDFLLMPSRFEPCGLTQMYAMKYGTIPIVRATGGLADTVHEYVPEYGSGTGFVFLHYYADDFDYAISRALRLYNHQPHWDLIRRNAMAENFSSANTAMEYLKVFKWALEKARGY
jgi:starch synthase